MFTNPYQNRGPLDPINWGDYGQIYSQPTSVSAGAQNAGNLFTGLGGNQLAQLLGQIGQNTTPTKIDTDLFALSPQTKKRNLALASIPASLGLIAASAPSTDPGAFAKGLGAAGQNLFTNVNALNNQAIQRNMLKYNMLRQAAADKRAAQLHPLQKKRLEAQSVPKPMFGSGQRGKALEIWTLAQRKPELKNDPSYTAAVGVLSTTTRVPTPQGVIEYPPMMSPDGTMYGTGKPAETEPTTVARPEPRIISQTAEQKLDLTPAERSIDLAFGKQYEKQIVAGGQADFDKNLKALDGVLSQLRTNDNLTGPMIGILSPTIKEFTYPKAAQAQETVEEVVQKNLRIILGAQFTAEEGKRLIKRAYNPSLQEPQNVERLERLINSMKKAREAQMAANEFFQEHGTLKGYKGTKVFSLNTIESAAGLTPGESDEEIGPPPKGVTLEEWRAMTPENRKLF